MLRKLWRLWHGHNSERQGSLLLEAMLGIILFALFATATYLTLLSGQESSQEGADRMRGMHYTQEALDVARAIRDRDFSELTEGDHGYDISEDGQWILDGLVTSRYGYSTVLTIQPIPDDKIRAIARTTWKHGYHRDGSIVLSVELTDWRNRAVEIGDWSTINTEWNSEVAGLPELNDVIVNDEYAFITSEAGDGLYIFDISIDDSPFRVSPNFSVGVAARSPVIYRDTLYLIVDNSADEIRAYDVSDPTSLVAITAPIATYDLPGNARGMALYRKGSILYVGTQGSASDSEFYSFDISDPAEITPLHVDGFNITENPTIFDVYVSGNYAYLGTSMETQEMIVIDISSPSAMVEHEAYNGTGPNYGLSVRASGTGFYLGRSEGGAIDEYILITGSNGTPDPASGPGTYGVDIGGSVNAMSMDPLGCYAFMATDFIYKDLQIRSARHKTVEEVSYLNLDAEGEGIFYNMMNDRLYLTTSTGFYIFSPAANGDCE